MKMVRKTCLVGLIVAWLATACAAQVPSSQPAPALGQVSPAIAAVQDMAKAAGLLRQSDAGQGTQSLQTDALEQLRRIMEAMRKQQQQQQQQASQQPSNQPQPSANASDAQQPNSQGNSQKGSQDKQGSSSGQKGNKGQQSQQGGGQRSNQGGSQAAKDDLVPGQQSPAGAAALPGEPGKVEAWGFLPPDQRREVLQGMQAEPPARYRKLTERYWRVLNESAEQH